MIIYPSQQLKNDFLKIFKNEVLPIAELFDMAANPVRKLLNPGKFEDQNEVDLIAINGGEKTPFREYF